MIALEILQDVKDMIKQLDRSYKMIAIDLTKQHD